MKNIDLDRYIARFPVQTIGQGASAVRATLTGLSNGQIACIETHNTAGVQLPATASGNAAVQVPSGTSDVKWYFASDDRFADMFSELNDVSEFEYQLSPASIAAGATLEDMTDATDEDKANVTAWQKMFSRLS